MSQKERRSHNEQPTGSPPPGEPVFLVIGSLRKPHGVRGEIAMEVLTDFPERLISGGIVYVGSTYQAMTLRNLRWKNDLLLLSFIGYDDPDQVGLLRNQLVFVRSDEIAPLPEDEFYHHQLIGLQVIRETDEPLGVVTTILETGSNDVLVVESLSGAEVLLPYIDDVILEVDLAGGYIRVKLLPGLLP